MNTHANTRAVLLVWLVAGYAVAGSTEADDEKQGLAAARHAAKALLEPVGEAFGCEFARLRLVRERGFDGYVAHAGCTGERCTEALDALNERGKSRSLRFIFEESSDVDLAEEPPWEPTLGQFDLIHEINPDT